MANRTRSGFTLVELLVVIAIIGILMGLLLPAVGAAREAARRTQCANRIKQLSLATIQYEGKMRQLPGYLQNYGPYSGAAADPADSSNTPSAHTKYGTWAIALLPHLENMPLYERWTQDRYPILADSGTSHVGTGGYSALATPNVDVFQCPSNPITTADFGRNSYCANTGYYPESSSSSSTPITGSGGGAPSAADFNTAEGRKANGAFNSKVAVGDWAAGPSVRLDDFRDGLGTTIMFAENLQANPWYSISLGAAFPTGTLAPEEAKCTTGVVWLDRGPNPTEPELFINGGPSDVDLYSVDHLSETYQGDYHLYARPSSAHSGGVNVAMASNRVIFISDSIDYQVYQALLTLRGKSSQVPEPEFVLQDDAI